MYVSLVIVDPQNNAVALLSSYQPSAEDIRIFLPLYTYSILVALFIATTIMATIITQLPHSCKLMSA